MNQIIHQNKRQLRNLEAYFDRKFDAENLIDAVLAGCPTYSPPKYDFYAYPAMQVISPQGLTVETPYVYAQAMKLHNQYLLKNREIITNKMAIIANA